MLLLYEGTGSPCNATVYPRGKEKCMKLESCVPHHIFPVEHLQDVTKQLAASLRLLPLLQVKLQLVRHQRQEDLTAICRDSTRYTHSQCHSTQGADDRSHEAVQHMLSTHGRWGRTQLVNGFLTAQRIKLKQCTQWIDLLRWLWLKLPKSLRTVIVQQRDYPNSSTKP